MVMRPAQPTHRRHRTGLLAAPATARLGLLPRTYTVRAGDSLVQVTPERPLDELGVTLPDRTPTAAS